MNDLVTIAMEVSGTNVVGGSVLKPETEIQSHWYVVTRADGVRTRLDTEPVAPPIQASVDAVMNADISPTAIANRNLVRDRAVAQEQVIRKIPDNVQLRSVLLVAVDEINNLRQWLTSFKAAVAAATTLADLKTRVAALPNTPDRTPAQAKAAILNKMGSGDAD